VIEDCRHIGLAHRAWLAKIGRRSGITLLNLAPAFFFGYVGRVGPQRDYSTGRMEHDPLLKDLLILRMRTGTNFQSRPSTRCV
jgi:hypothetical protein